MRVTTTLFLSSELAEVLFKETLISPDHPLRRCSTLSYDSYNTTKPVTAAPIA
jgi:hypothetical protein